MRNSRIHSDLRTRSGSAIVAPSALSLAHRMKGTHPVKLTTAALVGAVACSLAASRARADFSENFDDVSALAGQGWTFANKSAPLGITNWFQGNPEVFPAHSGAPNSYIAANFNNILTSGVISNWAILPTMTLNDGDTVSFYSRVPVGVAGFPDRLEVRLSQNGSSSDTGADATTVGDFSTLLLSINPDLTNEYPTDWTKFTVSLAGLGGPITGRIAFRYFVTDAGPLGSNGNYIGIDTLTVETQVIPLPTAGLMGSVGLLALASRRRRA